MAPPFSTSHARSPHVPLVHSSTTVLHPVSPCPPCIPECVPSPPGGCRGDPLYSNEQIAACLARATPAALDVPLRLPRDIALTAHYAGHVIGAAMFHVRVGAASVLYTGDYNMSADRHLGAAHVPAMPAPDALITESTFAATLREPRRARERRFLEAVHATVRGGGKVLIPVFALGNAQELSVLVDGYWRRQGLQVPLYMTAGMASKAAAIFATLSEWGSQSVRRDAASGDGSPFASPRFQPWQPAFVHSDGPCVLFATPGMLHGGTSLRVFKEWAPGPKNLVLLPGYCTSGTIGHMLMKRGSAKKGEAKTLQIEGQDVVVRCKVRGEARACLSGGGALALRRASVKL
jgi:integrator complex subunit 11